MRPASLSALVLGALLSAATAQAQGGPPGAAGPLSAPRAFVENRGQWSNGALFQMRRGNSIVGVTADGFTIQMLRVDRLGVADREHEAHDLPLVVSGWSLSLRFRDADPSAVVVGVDELPGVHNYLRGSDPAGWVTKARGYAAARIKGLYPGIDLELYEHNLQLEYDLVLAPGADPSGIVVDIVGAESVAEDEVGRLVMRTPWQDVIHSGPTCRGGGCGPEQPIRATCRPSSGTSFSFSVQGWDGAQPLIIDPTVVYATYLGGSGTEEPYGIAANDGAVVVGGHTLSADFPFSPGAFQTSQMGLGDVFITSLTPDGSSLIYSTLLGGVEQDVLSDIVIGADGLAIVAGYCSPGFPVTPGAYDVTHSGVGVADAFVAKLNADGSDLVFSTLFGGSDGAPATHVDLGPDGSIYITGLTESPDLPTTPNAQSSSLLANVAAYVARFSPDGSQLLASSYLGGTARTKGRGLGVDAEGNAYITGYAGGNPNTPLPVTPGAFDMVGNGEVDAFVAKFTPDLTDLVYCTYVGGEFFDEACGLALDSTGAAYVTGITDSKHFPTTSGALDTHEDGPQDAFVIKLDPNGSSLMFATYLGGGGDDDADDIAVGSDGSTFVAGDLLSSISNFPLTPDGWDTTLGGPGDAYLVRLDPTGSTSSYGTLIGGSFNEECRTMGLDDSGNVFVAGEVFSPDFPATQGALESELDGVKDCFVVRIAFGPWIAMGSALAGGNGSPHLDGVGTLQAGSPGELDLTGAALLASAALVAGLSTIDAPFKGGTLVPAPLLVLPLVTDGSGGFVLSWSAWPAGIPSGTAIDLQAWIHDAGGPKGWAASNDLRAVTP